MKKRTSKLFRGLMALLLVVSVFLPALRLNGVVSAAEKTESDYTLTTEPTAKTLRLDDHAKYTDVKFRLKTTYAFRDNVTLNNGDFMVYHVPNEFKIEQDSTTDLKAATGETIATLTTEKATNTAKITVTNPEYFKKLSEGKEITASFTVVWADHIEKDKEYIIDIPGAGVYHLTRIVHEGDGAEFDPDPEPYEATVELKATKVLKNKTLEADKYTFELKENGRVVSTAKNAQDGSIKFPAITYETDGVHTYTVTEQTGTEDDGVVYDSNAYEVTVEVEYNDYGRLVAKVKNGDNLTFTNVYSAKPVKKALTATKVLNGGTLADDQFEFELKEGQNVVATAKNKADGTVTFKEIEYTAAGKHTYTVSEKADSAAGYTYDSNVYTVTVDVVDNGKGQLVATVTDNNPTFTNTYKAATTTATITATKVLNGKALEAGKYEFELKEGDKVVATAKNAADGTVTFEAIEYAAAGNHTYTITEKAGSEAGVTYDTAKHEIKVAVTDNGQGQLVATVENADAERVFTNTYKAASTATSATFEFTKELTGRALVDGEFQFELYEGTKLLDTKTNQGGKVTFNAINYGAEGVHTYTVKEVNAGATGITYDTEKTAVVKVTKDAATNALKAAVEYPAGSVFTNSFKAPAVEATMEATKKLEGKELVADAYTFELKENGAVVAEAKNTAEGKVAFVRSFEEAGTHTYTLVEKVGTEEGIEYDKTEHTVTVTVVADGQGFLTATVSYADGKAVVFTNKYTVPNPTLDPTPTPDPAPTPEPQPTPPVTEEKGKAELPKTGEATSIFSAIGFVVLALSGLVFFVKRKA